MIDYTKLNPTTELRKCPVCEKQGTFTTLEGRFICVHKAAAIDKENLAATDYCIILYPFNGEKENVTIKSAKKRTG